MLDAYVDDARSGAVPEILPVQAPVKGPLCGPTSTAGRRRGALVELE